MSDKPKQTNSLHDEKINAEGDKPKYPEAVNEFAEEFSDGAYGAPTHEELKSHSKVKSAANMERKQ